MSTVSGLTPNSLTPSVGPLSDPAQQAQLRRRNESAVFSPIEESEATSASQNRTDQNGADTRQSSASSAAQTTSTSQSAAPEQPEAAPSQPQTANPAEAAQSTQAEREDQSSTQAQARQRAEDQAQKAQLETIRDLARRDREVRNHEQAHQTIGGQYAGAMKLDYTTGPDGRRYAVSGEVPIDLSPVPGNPEATRAKAQQVRQAALAPAEPSNQDRAVAAQATQIALQAQIELRQQERSQSADSDNEVEESRAIEQESENRTEQSSEQNNVEKTEDADNARERLESIFTDSQQTNDRVLVREQYRDQQATVGRNFDFIV